jgi:hypothetical protein
VNLWKVLGVAGLVGVAATGAVLARAERRRRAYTPEEIRSRLHERLAEAERAAAPGRVP